MTLCVKTFVVPDSAKGSDGVEDKLAIDEKKKRFVIADGVSACCLPDIWAYIITNAFVNSDVLPEQFFEKLDEKSFDQMKKDYSCRSAEYESTLKGLEARRLSRVKKLFGNAASTIAGLYIEGNLAHFIVLGDSCIFFVNDDGMHVYSCVKDKYSFDNIPDCWSSSGDISGSPVTGSVRLKSGYIVMATDELAKWFWHYQDEDKSIVDNLWRNESLKDFENFITNERLSQRMKDDDVALVIIKMINAIDTAKPMPMRPNKPNNGSSFSMWKWLFEKIVKFFHFK